MPADRTPAPVPPAAPTTGRCGHRLSDWVCGPGAVVCALPAGHAGWHRSDEGTEWETASPDPYDAILKREYDRGVAAGRTPNEMAASVAPTPVPTDAEIAEGMPRDDVEAHRIYSDWARDGSKPVLAAIREALAAGRTAAAADIAEKLDAMADDEAQRPTRDDRSYVIEAWLREAAGIAALIDEGPDHG